MIVTTIVHSGDAHDVACEIQQFLGETATVGIFHLDGVPIIRIVRVDDASREGVVFVPPGHRFISGDGGATFKAEPVVINPAREIERLQQAVDSWRTRWLEESKNADDFARRADELETEVQELSIRLAAAEAGLKDEYGILRYRNAYPGPNVMPAENAALAIDLRPSGVFGPDVSRPGTLMRRRATDWEEIPADVTPDDIVPGYSARRAAIPGLNVTKGVGS